MLLMRNFASLNLPGSEPFGDWLRREREKHNWSQTDLGNYSGLGRSTINKLENHDQFPTTYNYINLSDAFNMAPEDLMRIAGLLPPKKAKEPPTVGDSFQFAPVDRLNPRPLPANGRFHPCQAIRYQQTEILHVFGKVTCDFVICLTLILDCTHE